MNWTEQQIKHLLYKIRFTFSDSCHLFFIGPLKMAHLLTQSTLIDIFDSGREHGISQSNADPLWIKQNTTTN